MNKIIIALVLILTIGGVVWWSRQAPDTTSEAPTFTRTETYTCEADVILMTDFNEDASIARVTTQSGSAYTMEHTEAASGVKYVGENAEFFTKGDEAMFSVDGEVYAQNCILGTPSEEEPNLEISRTGELSEMVEVTAPALGAEVASPITVEGNAPGNWFFEASAPVNVVDWDGKIIGEGYIQADGDWMTTDLVPFSGTIEYAIGPNEYSYRGALILMRDNPSDLPENDAAVEIPITLVGQGE